MRDARVRTITLARRLGIPRATVHERIKRLKEQGYIKGFTTALDLPKLGKPVTAFVLVSFQSNPKVSQRRLAEQIASLQYVTEVYIVSGEWDILAKVRAPSLEDVGRLVVDRLRAMQGVSKTVTSACFLTLKEEISSLMAEPSSLI